MRDEAGRGRSPLGRIDAGTVPSPDRTIPAGGRTAAFGGSGACDGRTVSGPGATSSKPRRGNAGVSEGRRSVSEPSEVLVTAVPRRTPSSDEAWRVLRKAPRPTAKIPT